MAIVETKAGAYKGISLLLVSSSIAGGRKDVLFEYPNSDRQFVEDQGLRKRVYTMRIVVPHTDFIETRDNILRVLEEGGVGPLDHPYYGRIENVAARSYVIDERETSLGRAEIQVEFTVSDNAAIPEKSFNSISEAATLNDVLGDSLTADIADGFEVDEGLVGNFQDAQDMLNDVSEAFDEVTAGERSTRRDASTSLELACSAQPTRCARYRVSRSHRRSRRSSPCRLRGPRPR